MSLASFSMFSQAEHEPPSWRGYIRTDYPTTDISSQGLLATDTLKMCQASYESMHKEAGLEQLRDLYGRGHFGMILIGMPGLEKRLARYPQLHSRVGFVHQFRVLAEEETRSLLEKRWSERGMKIRVEDFTDQEAISALIRITGGNFRVLHRLLMQIERLLEINELRMVTKEVVEEAGSMLVLGQA